MRSPHQLMPVYHPRRSWTLTRLMALVAGTALGVAVIVGAVVGLALFAILNIAG